MALTQKKTDFVGRYATWAASTYVTSHLVVCEVPEARLSVNDKASYLIKSISILKHKYTFTTSR